jgi:hypothetical protein
MHVLWNENIINFKFLLIILSEGYSLLVYLLVEHVDLKHFSLQLVLLSCQIWKLSLRTLFYGRDEFCMPLEKWNTKLLLL